MNLTRLGTVAAVLIPALGIVGQWSMAELPWWRLAAAVLVVGLAYEFVVTRWRSIRARVSGDTRLFLGRDESLALEFENTSRRILRLEFVPTTPDGVTCPRAARTLTLAPLGLSGVELAIRPAALGRHEWSAIPARVAGPLGLAWWSRTLTLDTVLDVLPDTLGARGNAAAIDRIGSNPESALGGGMELHHLRDYRPGDPLKALDWKATAKTSRLITRVFSEDQHLEVMILIDVGRTSRTQIDDINQCGHFVNLAARLAEYCAAADDHVGLMAFADRPLDTLRPGRGLPAVRRLRQVLARLQPVAVESDVLQAALHVRTMLRHRCLVVILTDLYERSATAQLVQATKLLLPNHLPLVVGIMSDDVIALTHLEASDWLDPYRSLAGREYRRHVAGSIARLVQLGAHALAARPAELDRAVLTHYDRLRAQRRV